MECKDQAAWGVVLASEEGISCCRGHLGHVLENLFKRDVVEYKLAYLLDPGVKAFPCEGADAGKAARVSVRPVAKGSILGVTE